MANPFTAKVAPQSLIAPDITQEQTRLSRQQQLADMLKQQALQSNGDTQVVSGVAVRKSPWETVAKLAQAYFGQKMQGDIDSKQTELAKALQERTGSAFDQMTGAQPSATPQATPQPGAPESSADPASAQPPQMPSQAAPETNKQRILRQAKAAYLMGNTELANQLISNVSTLTNEQRNMAAMGQDPLQMGKYGMAEAHKKGIIELQPGTTALDLSNGQERFHPKVGEGITLQGGQASVLPGYAGANAAIEGAKAGAVASAQAGNEMITVNTPNGPMMVTKSQARDMATGGQAGAQAAPQFQGEDLLNQLPESVRAGILKNAQSGDGKFDVNYQLPNGRRIAGSVDLNSSATGSSGFGKQGPGIALQDDGSSAFAKKVNEGGASVLLESRDKAKSAIEEINAIGEGRKAIQSGAYQGFGADFKTDAIKMAQGFGIPVDASKASNTDYLRSALGKGIMDNAKKLGINPTDADAKRLDQIMGTIGKDPKAMENIFNWREQMANKVIDQHNNDIESAQKNGARFPFDLRVNRPTPAAPAGGFQVDPNAIQAELERRRKGK